jgi:2-polyprenyl-3-methyl-5-hydroxy-6-metoxy-1,4-benzoquinol methylase
MTMLLSTEDACPSCDGRELRRLFAKGGREFWRCTSCALERQFPLPTMDVLRAYYEGNYGGVGRLAAMFEAERMLLVRAAHRLREVQPHLEPGRWLDVGASDGTFVATAREAGVDAEGIELASAAVEHARARGRPVACACIEDHVAAGASERYDTVTAFDVLEHVLDPKRFVQSARRLLRAGGTLALTVPNQRALSRRMMGRHWYFYIPDGHLFYFNAANLQALLTREGFQVCRTTTTWKAITYRYTLSQLQVLNPVLDTALRPFVAIMPRGWSDAPIPLPLGELLMVARRS